MVLVTLAVIGCPANPHSTTGISTNGVLAPTQAPSGTGQSPQPGSTTAPPVFVTPIPVATGGQQNATPPPPSLFASPTPSPSPLPTPTLEPLDVQIFEGSGTSNFAQNLFVIPASGDLPHLDPPSSRSYSAFNDLGIGPSLASSSGFAQEKVATASEAANWTLSQIATIDVRPVGLVLPATADLVYFKLPGGATASSVNATDTVEIDLATVSSGVLVTLSADVNAQTGQVFDGGASSSVTLPILASNEGQVSFTISNLRLTQFERVTP